MVSRMRLAVMLLIGGLLMSAVSLVLAGPPAQSSSDLILVAARTDLETLANTLIGPDQRPVGWTNSFDSSVASFPIDLRLDLETLAGTVLAPDRRPEGWFGAVPGTTWAIARDIRHDLELLAAETLTPEIQPAIWIGDDPLMSCSRELQATVAWLERTNSAFSLSAPQSGSNYCVQSAQEVDVIVEVLLPANMPNGDLRADLNRLYTIVVGSEEFPTEWSGDTTPAGIRQDLEYMRRVTSNILREITDADWFGAVFGSDWVVARANRHDLEILAYFKTPSDDQPEGWTYTGPDLVRCPRAVQNLVALIEFGGGFTYEPTAISPDYCQFISRQATSFVESGVGGPGIGGGTIPTGDQPTDGGITMGPVETAVGGVSALATSPNAYLDRRARVQIGVIPRNTPLTALARSGGENSRMMYVVGEGFQVWAAWPWTTMTETQYLSLPLVDNILLPPLLCYAYWCQSVVRNGNPMGNGVELAAGDYGGVGVPGSTLQEVYDANVRLFFDVDNVAENWAEFRGELCGIPRNYATCEPALRLYENGQLVQPLRVVNGYPVWRMSYNLHSNARMESYSYVKIQLWVSHPYSPR